MIVIRPAQTEAFKPDAIDRFATGLLPHVERYFPNHYAILGVETVYQVIQLGISRAAAHGISSQRDVCLYVNLMWLFGSHFDRDPTLSWAAAALSTEQGYTATMRIDRLTAHGLYQFDKAAGEHHFLLNRAMLRLHQDLPKICAQAASDGVEAMLLNVLPQVYPSRFELMDQHGFGKLVEAATIKARRYQLSSAQGKSLLALVMFMSGCDFDEDPQHGWAKGALRQAGTMSEDDILNLLCQKAQLHLARWLERKS